MAETEPIEVKVNESGVKMYVLTREEKISFDYHVPARSMKEALAIFNHEDIDEYVFKDHNSHCHVRYYAPKKSYQSSLHDYDMYGPNTENGSDLDQLYVWLSYE